MTTPTAPSSSRPTQRVRVILSRWGLLPGQDVEVELSRLIGTMNGQERPDAPSPDLSAVAAQIAEAVKGIPGVSGATMVAVPMRGGQPIGDPIPLGEVKADEEPPAPGMYL